ncbi:MAG: phosphopantothenate/pantothenate synthetase [Candidatus Altiarchaeales archaeon]|nr:phosphopantothenate/pantothenate synthetase [Candidatus Altiarchaeales archaeon]MBD3416968.1 phosphopantothenate/pantothenate synthetase [Candidatus Altiarchaeales archaeon]
MTVPVSHPRKMSLDLRHRLTDAFERGVVASAGLIAHGRGEAFDYLLGERTWEQAGEAATAASALLLAAEKPAISVNGNSAALSAAEIGVLARVTGAKLEVNLFYRTLDREERIRDVLLAAGADTVYGVGVEENTVPGLESERSKSDTAILEADAVLVMLEDGDRTEKLKDMGKKVIAVDLNPLSRTAQKADITIVDNIVRALPNMIESAKELRGLGREELRAVVGAFDNERNLKEMEDRIRNG